MTLSIISILSLYIELTALGEIRACTKRLFRGPLQATLIREAR